MKEETAPMQTTNNYVCGRFLMFRDDTVEAAIVESGTEAQCQAVADAPPPDIDRGGEGWVRAQAFKVMTDDQWNSLMAETDRRERENDWT